MHLTTQISAQCQGLLSPSSYAGSDSVGLGKKLHWDSHQPPSVKEDLAKKSGPVGPLSIDTKIMGPNIEEIINPETIRDRSRSNKPFPLLKKGRWPMPPDKL